MKVANQNLFVNWADVSLQLLLLKSSMVEPTDNVVFFSTPTISLLLLSKLMIEGQPMINYDKIFNKSSAIIFFLTSLSNCYWQVGKYVTNND